MGGLSGMSNSAAMGAIDKSLAWLVPMGLVILWQVSSGLGWLPPNILPAPSAVLAVAWEKTLDGQPSRQILG
ncbi:MAG: hypothetical protein HC777_03310, partial [Hyphomonadaceae bacterium]|nr:hypothetical protein [Hyphomonadaceae bacterium]